LSDLAAQFATVVREMYPDAAMSLVHRHAAASDWQLLCGKDSIETSRLQLPQGEAASLSLPFTSRDSLALVQKLIDRSYLGLVMTCPGHTFTDSDVLSLQLFLHLFDAAYQDLSYRRNEKRLVFSLNHKILQLTSLIDTGIEVAKLEHTASPHRLALERAASLTNAAKGRVTVQHENTSEEQVFFPAGPFSTADIPEHHQISASFTFSGRTYTFELFTKESREGVVPFDATDTLLLDALARQVHASLENRYLLQQSLEKQKIEQDIAVAASIQQRILPARLPEIAGFDLAGINIPSRWVGGDYYDCLPLSDGRFALVIADVAGKGVPASLLVSSFHAYLSAYLESGLAIVPLVQRLNTAICRASTDEKFITAFIAVLSPGTGELESVNAGHNPAYLLRRDGTVQDLDAGGVALGMLDMEFPFQTDKATLEPGDRLLLYTDGIPEATNTAQELYETSSPLKSFVQTHRPPHAREFIDTLLGDIRRFTGEAPQSDDITALYLLRQD
jgi:serine phosphatase RsbU (regulator of sigma subunit)